LADLSAAPVVAGMALYLDVNFSLKVFLNSFLVSGFLRDSSLTISLNSKSV